jgi:predicted nucleic acid-binding protein
MRKQKELFLALAEDPETVVITADGRLLRIPDVLQPG